MTPIKVALTLLKIGLIILLLDGFIQSLPGVISIATGKEYLDQEPGFSILRFLQFSAFITILYTIHVSGIYAILVFVYYSVFKVLTPGMLRCILGGVLLGGGFYLYYAFVMSADAALEAFGWKILLKISLGGLFGFLFWRKIGKAEAPH